MDPGRPATSSPPLEAIHYLKNKFYYIKSRCHNPNDWNYSRYGAKGIKVCREWLEDTNNFVKWALKNGWSQGLTIERVDNNKGYSPNNCTWIPPHEQYYNRSDTVTDFKNKTRICQHCKEKKNLSEFHKNSSKPLGHHYVCKICRNKNRSIGGIKH